MVLKNGMVLRHVFFVLHYFICVFFLLISFLGFLFDVYFRSVIFNKSGLSTVRA